MALIPGEETSFMMELLAKGVSNKDKENYKDADRLAMMGNRFPGGFIPDEEASINNSQIPATADQYGFIDRMRNKDKGEIGKTLNHPELYKYYPELAKMETQNKNTDGYIGAFAGIGDGKYFLGQDAPRNTVLHETQHAVDWLDRDKKDLHNSKTVINDWMAKQPGDKRKSMVGKFNDDMGYRLGYLLSGDEVRGRMTGQGKGAKVSEYISAFDDEVVNTVKNTFPRVTKDNVSDFYVKWQTVMEGFNNGASMDDMYKNLDNFVGYVNNLPEVK